MRLLSFLLICGFLSLLQEGQAHTYKSGECPALEPMQGFDMRKVRNHYSCFSSSNLMMTYEEVVSIGNIRRQIRRITKLFLKTNSGNFYETYLKESIEEILQLIKIELHEPFNNIIYKFFCKAFIKK